MLFALLLLFASPRHALPAVVAETTPSRSYHTYIRRRYQAFGYAGELTIRVRDGYVHGTYRPESGGRLSTVTGGTDGKHIWFDLATLGGIHVNAAYEGERIVGSGVSHGTHTWVFTATPNGSR